MYNRFQEYGEPEEIDEFEGDWDDYDEDGDLYEDDEITRDNIDGVGFADPGSGSALRAETPENPRDLPCPSCHEPNRLTRIDKARGYQCDQCADAAEGPGY